MLVLTMVVYSAAAAAAAATSPWLSPAQLAAAADSSGAETAPVSVMELLAALEGSDDRRLQEIPIIDVSAQQGQDQEPGQFQHRRFRHEASAVRILYQIGVSIIMCIGRALALRNRVPGPGSGSDIVRVYDKRSNREFRSFFRRAKCTPHKLLSPSKTVVPSSKGMGGNFPVAPDVSHTDVHFVGYTLSTTRTSTYTTYAYLRAKTRGPCNRRFYDFVANRRHTMRAYVRKESTRTRGPSMHHCVRTRVFLSLLLLLSYVL